MDERLKRLIARRDEITKKRDELREKRSAIVQVAKDEGREDLSTEEDAEFRKFAEQIKDLEQGDEERGIAGIAPLQERIEELIEEEQRQATIAKGTAKIRSAIEKARVTSEARTYVKGNGRSYLQDIARVSMQMDGSGESRARLQRHAEEVASDQEFRDLTRTDGDGGYFVPPLWLMSQWIELARSSRATANVATSQDLPPGTDSINIPKVLTGTSTAVQTADNAGVSETDLTDDVVTAPVRTIAGQQDVAIQLLDQSPVNFDEVIFRDLLADYATKLDLQVIGGTGLSGQVTGIRETSDIETIAYTDASPTAGELYSKIADAVQRVHTLRFMPPTVIVMHPRRWAFLLAAVDTTGRPLVVPGAGMPQNAMGTLGAVASEQVVGQMHGLPVVTDPNLPATEGAGTNEDVILVMRASDLLLYESSIRSRVLPETLSGNLTVRLQVYGYLAFAAGRYPKSVVEIGGTGLIAPTF